MTTLKQSLTEAREESVATARAEYLTILNRRHKPHAGDGKSLLDCMLKIGKTEADLESDLQALDDAERLEVEAADADGAKLAFEAARVEAQAAEMEYQQVVEAAESKRFAATRAMNQARSAWGEKNKAGTELRDLKRRHADLFGDVE